MKFRENTTFPFLALAQYLGVNYGTVLLYADLVDPIVAHCDVHHVLAWKALTVHQKDAVAEIQNRESIRRANVREKRQ